MPTTVEEVCNFLIHRPISWLVNVCVGSATGLSCRDVAVEAEGLELVLMDSGQMRAQVPAVSVRSCQPRWRRLHLLEPQGLPQALAQGALHTRAASPREREWTEPHATLLPHLWSCGIQVGPVCTCCGERSAPSPTIQVAVVWDGSDHRQEGAAESALGGGVTSWRPLGKN